MRTHRMLSTLEPLLSTLPPKTKTALLAAINRCGTKLGMPPNWVQRWIGFALVADALLKNRDDAASLFEIKGGAAIELRLRQHAGGIKPRASKDLDATFRGALDEIEGAVEQAMELARGDFSYRLITEDVHPEHMRRFSVAVSYKGDSFARVKLEISSYEGTHRTPERVLAPDLTDFGLHTTDEWPCLPLSKQVAQKIHAVTEVIDGRENDRYRDLADLILLSMLAPASPEIRDVCEETFRVRAKHGWPPSVQAPESWREPLERIAREIDLSQQDADEIVWHVQAYIDAIASA